VFRIVLTFVGVGVSTTKSVCVVAVVITVLAPFTVSVLTVVEKCLDAA
jgi:hypothetical protein